MPLPMLQALQPMQRAKPQPLPVMPLLLPVMRLPTLLLTPPRTPLTPPSPWLTKPRMPPSNTSLQATQTARISWPFLFGATAR